jgi:isocitrate lyase
MIEAGVAGGHFEDQLASAKKCERMSVKVLVPTGEFIQKLIAACLAADVLGEPTVLAAEGARAASKSLALSLKIQNRPTTSPVGFIDCPCPFMVICSRS